MFAHQVIEDLMKLNPVYLDTYESLKYAILRAQKFHIGNAGKLPDITGQVVDFNGCMLPYNTCWIDFTASNRNNANEFVEHCLMPKRGILAIQDTKTENSPIFIHIFNYHGKDSWAAGTWVPNIFTYMMLSREKMSDLVDCSYVPYAINESENSIRQRKNKIKSKPHSVIQSIPIFKDENLYKSITPDKYNEILYGDSQDISTLRIFLTLLDCKNIGTETVPAPVKLNNKRKKAGKQPIFSYKTLVIKPVGKKQESIPKHLWNNRIHLARGHFKTYTEDKPLFGKITGRFWWQPQVRGQNRDGVVMKDYLVKQ